MRTIFIAYAGRDRVHMQLLREYLNKAGYNVLVNRAVGQDDSWSLEVFDMIRDASLVIPLLTQAGADSVDVSYEWAVALGARVPVYPVLFRGVNAHPHLMILEMYDFGAHTEESKAWQQITREVQRILGDEVTVTTLEKSAAGTEKESPTIPLSASGSGGAGSQRASGYYLTVQIANLPTQEFRLDAAIVSIGRDEHNDIQLPNAGVSRSHLRFLRTDSGYRAIDMGSTNGTFFASGERLESAQLNSGDVLLIGDQIKLIYHHIP